MPFCYEPLPENAKKGRRGPYTVPRGSLTRDHQEEIFMKCGVKATSRPMRKGRRGKELDVMHELTLHGPEEQLDVAEALCFDIVGSLALSRLAGHAESSQTQCELPPYMPSIPPDGVHDEAHSPAQECAHADQKVEETLHDEAHHPAQECTRDDLPEK